MIGPLRATLLLARCRRPTDFAENGSCGPTAACGGDGLSADYRYVDGQLKRSKKPQPILGLNQNHNHAMKEIFKGTALSASRCAGPLQDFYEGLLAKGMKPETARLTLARKIAAITLTLWKKENVSTPNI